MKHKSEQELKERLRQWIRIEEVSKKMMRNKANEKEINRDKQKK